MKTVKEIVEYLEAELRETNEMYDEAQDGQARLFNLIKIGTLKQIIREIKEEE